MNFLVLLTIKFKYKKISGTNRQWIPSTTQKNLMKCKNYLNKFKKKYKNQPQNHPLERKNQLISTPLTLPENNPKNPYLPKNPAHPKKFPLLKNLNPLENL